MSDAIIGLSDRLCTFSSYSTKTDERNIHNHLYNRFTEERSLTYKRFYKSFSEKNCIVIREIIKDERLVTYNRFYTKDDERLIFQPDSYIPHNSNRFLTYNRWYPQQSERLINFGITVFSERNIYQFCKWNTARHCFFKSWHVSERECTSLGKLFTSYASQRDLWYQLYPSLHSIRNICYEKSHFKINFSINPSYVSALEDKQINPNYQPIFENEIVTDYEIEFNYLKIKDNLKDTDLALVYWHPFKTEWIEVPLSMYGLINLPLFRYNDTNTLSLTGFFIPVSDMFYYAFYPICDEYNFNYDNNLCLDNIHEAERHGYIKLDINKQQYYWNTKKTLTQVKYQPITFDFYIEQNYLKSFLNRFNIRFLYGYPEKGRTYGILLSFNYFLM